MKLTEKQLIALKAMPPAERIAAHEALTGKTGKQFAAQTKARIHAEYKKSQKCGLNCFFK